MSLPVVIVFFLKVWQRKFLYNRDSEKQEKLTYLEKEIRLCSLFKYPIEAGILQHTLSVFMGGLWKHTVLEIQKEGDTYMASG